MTGVDGLQANGRLDSSEVGASSRKGDVSSSSTKILEMWERFVEDPKTGKIRGSTPEERNANRRACYDAAQGL